MKKIGIGLCCFIMMCLPVQAESYCVMSGEDHGVVEEKNMHEVQSVASISKIMSALVAIEQGDLNDHWLVSDAIKQVDGSSVYLQVGQEVSLESLLYALMLRSGNDAAVEIATHISGSEEAFVDLMNEKARQLNMVDTTFVNASGLDEEDGGNLSSAYDMALLMSEAMKNETFSLISGSQYYTSEWKLRWKNKNKLLFEYEAITGGKTGYTKKAGRTLVTSAAKDEVDSIVVTLGTPDDFNFHRKQHESFLSQITEYTLMKAGTYHLQAHEVVLDTDLKISLHQDGSDQIAVKSYIKDHQYIIEVSRNGVLETYSYEANKTGGWIK